MKRQEHTAEIVVITYDDPEDHAITIAEEYDDPRHMEQHQKLQAEGYYHAYDDSLGQPVYLPKE